MIQLILQKLSRSLGYEVIKCTPHKIMLLKSSGIHLRDIIAEVESLWVL
jgi:hypothetical protein